MGLWWRVVVAALTFATAVVADVNCTRGNVHQCARTVCALGDYQCDFVQDGKPQSQCYTSVTKASQRCTGACFSVDSCERTCKPCNTSDSLIEAACKMCPMSDPAVCFHLVGAPGCMPAENATDPVTCESCCIATEACHTCQRNCTEAECAICNSGRDGQLCISPSMQCSSGPHEFPNGFCDECCSRESCNNTSPNAGGCTKPNIMDCVPLNDTVLCNVTSPVFGAVSPASTPYGGMDVSDKGCNVFINSPSCCGYFPRFNWVISTCNATERNSQACVHRGANDTGMVVNYVAAYQWNGTVWVMDPTSSAMNQSQVTEMIVDTGGDWDVKFGPRTETRGTQGLGPPGMMWVVSAERFAWSAFYALNQITINRGPGGHFYEDNCWSSSSGEFDFFESPFWAGVVIPTNRLYFTTTADSGRCIPTAKTVTNRFKEYCNNEECCLMCSCGNITSGGVCFGNASLVGRAPMGCMPGSGSVPEGNTVFEVLENNISCARHFGAIGGGASSSSYFVQADPKGEIPMIYVGIVDGDGVTSYRWMSEDEGVWDGLTRYTAAPVLNVTRPRRMTFTTPCNTTEPCGIHQPSCPGDCPVVEASGTYGKFQEAGEYSSEAAALGLNWWDLFESTGQVERLKPHDMPHYEWVKYVPIKPPFNCSHDCGSYCANQSCPLAAPYMCTKGDGFGGCTNATSYWPFSGHCSACCNVSSCEFSCSGWCTGKDYERFCTPSADAHCPEFSYVCSSGASTGGCSPSAHFWGVTPGCTSCCQCFVLDDTCSELRPRSLPSFGLFFVIITMLVATLLFRRRQREYYLPPTKPLC